MHPRAIEQLCASENKNAQLVEAFIDWLQQQRPTTSICIYDGILLHVPDLPFPCYQRLRSCDAVKLIHALPAEENP